MDSTFFDVLRKSVPVEKAKTANQLNERNYPKDVQALIEILRKFSRTKTVKDEFSGRDKEIPYYNVDDSSVRDIVQKFNTEIGPRLDELTTTVRRAEAIKDPLKRRRRFNMLSGGRYTDVFLADDDEFLKYGSKPANEIYLDLITELSASRSGENLSEQQYRRMVEYNNKIRDVFSQPNQIVKKLNDDIDSGTLDFEKSEERLKDVFALVAEDLEEYKQLQKETGFKGQEFVLATGFDGGLSNDIREAVDFVNKAYSFVSKIARGTETSDIEVEEGQEQLRGILQEDTSMVVRAKNTLKMFDRFIKDAKIKNHTFSLPDGDNIKITLN